MADDDSSDISPNEESEMYTLAGERITVSTKERISLHRHELPLVVPTKNHHSTISSIPSSLQTSPHRHHQNIYRTSFIDHYQHKERHNHVHSATTTTRYQSRERIDIDSQQQNVLSAETRSRTVGTATFANAATELEQ
jgi:hypothetical protein